MYIVTAEYFVCFDALYKKKTFTPSPTYGHANVVEHLCFISTRLFVPQAQWHSRSNAGSMSLAASAENMSRKNSVGGEIAVE